MILIKDENISYDSNVIEDLGILIASLAKNSKQSTPEFIEHLITYIKDIAKSGLIDEIGESLVDGFNTDKE